ncbi:MAG: RICIN domain-containing protein [Eubacteriales bacterium]|nr:RICIN domain-containing protein [Eubacteriales bacterium]
MKRMKRLLEVILSLLMLSSVCLLPAQAVLADSPAPRLISGEIYYIKNKNSGQYLMVEGSSSTANSRESVIQSKDRSSSNIRKRQQWRLDYIGSGEYRIVSMASPSDSTFVLDVYSSVNSNGTDIDVYADANASDRRWKIILNSDNCSYRIMSKCSNFTKGVTVQNASCSSGANVFQYQYNASKNDEWIFEPVYNYSVALGVNYALTNFGTYYYTYPNLEDYGGDCANFVSQCMLAGGVHFQSQWWIFKKNNTYLKPQSDSQFDNSWDVQTMGGVPIFGWGASSPWISAEKFCDFWSSRVTYEDYKGSYITNNPSIISDRPFYKGDVISIIRSGEAFHTMYISGYGTYNGAMTYILTYHTNNTQQKSLLEIAALYPNDTFRFYTIN